ncbi:MAG: two-component regulator propeller domain-containing protein [Bacteroidota bacterium]|nr:two-component regulator propeller domain-containing protein [Bacteroidota bacterium]
MKQLILSLIFFSFYCSNVIAQIYPITTYGRKEGLTDEGVSSIIQDKKGYLWIGVQNGINKYNGKSFKKIEFDNFDGSYFYKDKKGTLWIGSGNSIIKLNGNTYINYKISSLNALGNRLIDFSSEYVIDSNQVIWKFFINSLFKIKDGKPTIVFTTKSIYNYPCTTIDNNGNIWIYGTG